MGRHESETCDEPGCEAAALVGINSRYVCTAHVDAAMGQAFAPVRAALKRLKE